MILFIFTGCSVTTSSTEVLKETQASEEVKLALEETQASEEIKLVLKETQPQAPILSPEEEFLNSPFRVVAIFHEPKSLYDIIVAADRSDELNDTICGSIYSGPYCHFFIEEGYHVDTPAAKYIGSYRTEGYIISDSVEFIGDTKFRFKSGEGDAGWFSTIEWELDVESGELIELNREEYSVDY